MTNNPPHEQHLRVLQSFRAPRGTTNPYLIQLLRSLPSDIVVSTFSWRAALLGTYDVLHIHWPEVILRGSTRTRSALRRALFRLLLMRLRLSSTAIVRTMHNVAPHESGIPAEDALLARLDRSTTLWLRLNPLTEPPPTGAPGAPVVTVLHGHYRDWFDARGHTPPPDAVPGRLLFFGLLRPYKGVELLLDTFMRTSESSLQLRIVGSPSSPELRAIVEDACGKDERITCRLAYVEDDELADEVHAAAAVVLPYRDFHNSGAALLALSLDRPVLVPDSDTTRALASEVGESWVLRFGEELTASDLVRASGAVHLTECIRPDLSARDWPALGVAHAAAFRRARALARKVTR